MGYVFKAFGENTIWNMLPSDNPNPITPAEITIISKGPEIIESVVNTEEGSFRVIVTGNFEFQEPTSSAAQASGKVSTFTVYKNGLLHEYEAYGTPVDLALTINTSFSEAMSWLSGDDLFVGSSTFDGQDYARAEGGNDTFTGFGDKKDGDYFYGGEGIDTSTYRGKYEGYSITKSSDIWNCFKNDGSRLSGYVIKDNVTGRDGIDNLVDVERLQFSDINVALDTAKGEIAGSAYRIYKAAFDRAPDAGGLGFWINAMDDGASLTSVAAGFIASPEFQKLYGANVSDRDYVTKLYNNVLDRNPDQGGYDFWLGAMAKGLSREDVLVNFSESNENIANVADLIASGIQYQEWIS